jgi:hypothetical protein
MQYVSDSRNWSKAVPCGQDPKSFEHQHEQAFLAEIQGLNPSAHPKHDLS